MKRLTEKQTVKLRELRQGNYFTLKEIQYPTMSQVWVKDYYDRSERQFWCHRYDDVNEGRFVSGDRIVYVDFIF